MDKPHAFLSYARIDDEFYGGAITKLRKWLELGVRVATGDRSFTIFQDIEAIEFGQHWPSRLDEALANARFLIPVLSPSFFTSEPCRDELTKFLELEERAGRRDLILPVYFVTTPLLERPTLRTADLLAQAIHERQWRDWRQHAHLSADHPDYRRVIFNLASAIAVAMERIEMTGNRPQLAAAGTISRHVEELPATRNLQGRRHLVGRSQLIKHALTVICESNTLLLEGPPGEGKTVLLMELGNLMYESDAIDVERVYYFDFDDSIDNGSDFDADLYEFLAGPDDGKRDGKRLSDSRRELSRILQKQKCLIILDNIHVAGIFWDTVKYLAAKLPQSNYLMLATRQALKMNESALSNLPTIRVTGLSERDVRNMVHSRFLEFNIKARLKDINTVSRNIYCLTRGNPLATIIILGYIKINGIDTVDFINDEPHNISNVLSIIIKRTWDQLDPPTRTLLLRAATFYSFERRVLLHLSGLDHDVALTAFSVLLARFLLMDFRIGEGETARYGLHPMIRFLVRFRTPGTSLVYSSVMNRTADFYLNYCLEKKVRLWEGIERYRGIESEWDNIFSSIQWFRECGKHAAVITMVLAAADYLLVRGRWDECYELGTMAIASSDQLGLTAEKAWLTIHTIGYIDTNRGNEEQAIQLLQHSYRIYEASGDLSGRVEALWHLGRVFRKSGRLADAEDAYKELRLMSPHTGKNHLEALALNEIGKLEQA